LSLITYSTEPWDEIKLEILPLWQSHWAEISDPEDADYIPLDPDWDEYQASADCGILHITAARSSGALVGYAFVFVKRGLHYKSTLLAHFDLYWVEPAMRGPWVGVRLFQEVERAMRARGVMKMTNRCKTWCDVSPIFARLGWKQDEAGFSKFIGD